MEKTRNIDGIPTFGRRQVSLDGIEHFARRNSVIGGKDQDGIERDKEYKNHGFGFVPGLFSSATKGTDSTASSLPSPKASVNDVTRIQPSVSHDHIGAQGLDAPEKEAQASAPFDEGHDAGRDKSQAASPVILQLHPPSPPRLKGHENQADVTPDVNLEAGLDLSGRSAVPVNAYMLPDPSGHPGSFLSKEKKESTQNVLDWREGIFAPEAYNVKDEEGRHGQVSILVHDPPNNVDAGSGDHEDEDPTLYDAKTSRIDNDERGAALEVFCFDLGPGFYNNQTTRRT